MAELNESTQEVCAFWNSRAGLGQWAGSRDVIAKQLEVEAIAAYVRDGMRVLEVGCGNGITAIEIARRYKVELLGIDFAEEMIAAATAMLADQQLKGAVRFQVGDVRSLADFSERFDLIYTERVLINLPDWQAQRQAIASIISLLADGGLYVMCENSQDGLDQINSLRQRVGLPGITPPWHNRYLRDAEIAQTSFPGTKLEGVNTYSSTYYFLSRIVNAWLAAQGGTEPDYDDPINQLALRLPSIGGLGQGRIWLWRKAGGTDGNIAPESAQGARVRLRRATEQDCGLLWEWANDPTVRDCSFSSRPIPFAEHVEWFQRKLADPRCIFYLATNGRSVPFGQVRYECKGEDAQVSVSVDCRFRRLGYGTKMIRLSAEAVFENTDVDTIHALVKPDNEASIRVFEKAGYRRVGTQTVGNQPALHLILRRED